MVAGTVWMRFRPGRVVLGELRCLAFLQRTSGTQHHQSDPKIAGTGGTKIWVRDALDSSVHEARLGEVVADGYVFESADDQEKTVRLEKEGVFYEAFA